MVTGPPETSSLPEPQEGKVDAGLEVARLGRSFSLRPELQWLGFGRRLRGQRMNRDRFCKRTCQDRVARGEQAGGGLRTRADSWISSLKD